MPRNYKANLGETRQGKRDIKHLLQKKKEIQFITSRKNNRKFSLHLLHVNFKCSNLLFELD